MQGPLSSIIQTKGEPPSVESRAPVDRSRSSTFGWMLMMVALAALGGALAWYFKPAWLGQRVSQIQSAVLMPSVPETSTNPPASAASAEQPVILAETLATLEQRITQSETLVRSQAAALTDLTNRLDKLEDDWKERLGKLEAGPASVGSASSVGIDTLRARVDQLADRIADASGAEHRLTVLEGEAKSLAERFVIGVDATRRATQVVIIGQLRDAILTGRAYTGELANLRQVKTEALPPSALEVVEKFAASGVSKVEQLAELLAQLAPEAVRAERFEKYPQWWTRMLDRLSSLITIRRVGEVEGQDAQAIIARAEQRLKAGDISAAAGEMAQLSGAAAEAVEPWVKAAANRVAVERALSEMQSAALSALAQTTKP